MRPIDADTLAEEIATMTVTVTGLRAGKGVLHEYMRQYRESVLRVIDEQPTVEAPEPPRWIPVEECLPETIPCAAGTAYSEAVIVWTSGRKAMIAVWNGEDFLCAADYWEAWGEHITHWMHLPRPLPKPPEEA